MSVWYMTVCPFGLGRQGVTETGGRTKSYHRLLHDESRTTGPNGVGLGPTGSETVSTVEEGLDEWFRWTVDTHVSIKGTPFFVDLRKEGKLDLRNPKDLRESTGGWRGRSHI